MFVYIFGNFVIRYICVCLTCFLIVSVRLSFLDCFLSIVLIFYFKGLVYRLLFVEFLFLVKWNFFF